MDDDTTERSGEDAGEVGAGGDRDGGDADAPTSGVDGGEFAANLADAREMLDAEDVDGLYVAVTRDDELDYAFAYQYDDAETVGMRALSLLAKHVQVIAAESGVDPETVAADAARLASEMGQREQEREQAGGE